ncbi:MAG: enoyl-CoA hydratase/isomerase family protein [Rhodospirillaceae bacterium]|nr:enoyl-CoA hydratase/isomerase family protein [Rhodospirillaceae bacterium]
MTNTLERPESIRVERGSAGCVTVTLARPEIHNAFDDVLIRDLTQIFNTLAREDETRVVMLTGDGRSFSAGADLNWMRRLADRTEHENFADAMQIAHLMASLAELPMTTVAKVNGSAFGGGVGLVACCDIAIVAEEAVFSLSEVRLGIVPGAVSPYVVAAIGAREARRYFQTGERFDAAEALRIGLAHKVVAAPELDAATDTLLAELAKSGPGATRAAKALIQAVEGKEIDGVVKRDTAQRIAQARATGEGKEGLSAFLEKRKPNWIKG